MSIRAQAAAEANANINADGVAVILTDSSDNEHDVIGHVWRTDVISDPDTGAKIIQPRTAVTVHLSDLAADPDETWTVETTDFDGSTVSGRVRSPMFDHTIGMVTFYIEVFE